MIVIGKNASANERQQKEIRSQSAAGVTRRCRSGCRQHGARTALLRLPRYCHHLLLLLQERSQSLQVWLR